MPASAVVDAAKTMIAVNVDNKNLCFIFNSPKNTVGEICWQRLPFLRYRGYRIKMIQSVHGSRKNPVITFVPFIGAQEVEHFLRFFASPSFVPYPPLKRTRSNVQHHLQKSNRLFQKPKLWSNATCAKPNLRSIRYRTEETFDIRKKERRREFFTCSQDSCIIWAV